METIYFTTKNFYKKPDNVVDFMEYKNKLERTRVHSLPLPQDEAPVLSVEHFQQPVSTAQKINSILDAAASLALTAGAIFVIFLLL